MLIILVLELRQEDSTFKAGLGYIVRHCLKGSILLSIRITYISQKGGSNKLSMTVSLESHDQY